MKIKVDDIYSQVLKPIYFPGLDIVREVCRARPSGFLFMPKYKSGRWDGYISLMGSNTKFPTGLLDRVISALANKDIKVELESSKIYNSDWDIGNDELNGITLRDYQIEAAKKLLSMGRGVAKMATNSGKTEVMAVIIKKLSLPTVVIVHRKELLYQTAERLSKRIGCKVGMIGDGVADMQDITVAMVQTLSNRNIDFSNNKVLIVDECHHISSDQMLNVVFRIPGEYRFGFSGTPLKHEVLSDLKLIAATGEVLIDISNKYLVDSGYSAKPKVHIITVESTDIDEWETSYFEAYESFIVNNTKRNAIIAEIASISSGTVLILVERIEHGEILHSLIPGSVFVNGSMDTEYRRGVLENMKSGGVFIATPIFDEGIDVPSISTLIVACGGNSSNKLLQRLGRGMRKKVYENVIQVYDFLDDTNQYLFKHSDKRIETFIEEGFEVVKYG